MTGRLEQIEEELKSIGGSGVKGVRNNGVKTASADAKKQNSIKNSERKQQDEDDEDEDEDESDEDDSDNDEDDDEASSEDSDSGVSALKEGPTDTKNTPAKNTPKGQHAAEKSKSKENQ